MMQRQRNLLLTLWVLCFLAPAGCRGERVTKSPHERTPSAATATRPLPTPTTAAEGEVGPVGGIELVGHLGSGQAAAIAVRDGLAYAGVDIQFVIADLSGPSPRRLGYLVLPSPVVDVALVGAYALVVLRDGAGLYVVDVSNPAIPVALDRTFAGPGGSSVVVSGSYTYVSDGTLRVFDLSNPTSPVEVASFTPPRNLTTAIDKVAAVVDERAYVTYYDHRQRQGGFWIVDVSDPSQPVQAGTSFFAGPVQDLVVAGSHAYLLVGQGLGRLAVVNVSDPQHPVESPLPDSAVWEGQSLAVAGHTLYLAHPGGPGVEGSVQVVDIADPDQPVVRGRSAGFASQVLGLALEGERAILATGDGLAVVDVSDPERPVEVGSYRHAALPLPARAVAVAGPYAYVAAGVAGLQVVDLSDPANPAVVATHDTAGYTWDVALAGRLLFLADEYNGLRILDVGNPLRPVEVGAYDVPGPYEFFHGVVVDSRYAYVADGSITDTGLRVVDISDPARPVEVNFLPLAPDSVEVLPPRVEGVAVAGNTVYLAAGTAGLRVVDVSEPSMPAEVGAYDTPGRADNLVVQGQRVYLSDGDLRIVDVSIPSAPALMGFFDLPTLSDTPCLFVQGQYAYLTGGGLRVRDVSVPGAPLEVAAHPWVTGQVLARGQEVYVAGNGLFILRTVSALTAASRSRFDLP